MNKNTNVGIVGAGIQGVSNALFLQKKGFNVTIFDCIIWYPAPKGSLSGSKKVSILSF